MSSRARKIIDEALELPEGELRGVVAELQRRVETKISPSDAARARLEAIGRFEGKGMYIADDFNAPLPDVVLDAFEGDSGDEPLGKP